MLNVENVHTYYGDAHILRGVSIEVGEGQVVGLLGRNGRGKTTLFRSIMGFTRPREGRIGFRGTDITNKHSFEIARLGIGVVPQGRLIFPSLSVEENLTVGFSLGPDGWTLDNIYELFPPLKQRARHPGNKLSGGEQQMLAIGRSLMTNPSLLLMDEPTAGLSPLYVEMLGEVIRKLQRSGISILLIEQRVGFALKHVEHVNIMERGTIVHSSPPDEVEANDRAIIKKYLGV